MAFMAQPYVVPARDENAARVHERTVSVEGRPARAFVGGKGEPLLLIHGGWGGAAMHWGSVWEELASRFAIVAPDLPGIGRVDQEGLGSVGAYAQWLCELLDELQVGSAWCVGNSFGASVACRFASDYSERCRGVVLVNGIPLPPSPPFLRWLGERPFGKRVMRAVEKRVAFTPAALARGFFDPAHVPSDLRALVTQPSPPQVSAFADVLVQGGSPAPRKLAPLLLWGEEDHLPGTSARAGRKLAASWPGATLALVPRAGHMPQLENPAAFVDALSAFVERGATPA
jgi:pimeloyl-ACP methyl ester carboxylesterase